MTDFNLDFPVEINESHRNKTSDSLCSIGKRLMQSSYVISNLKYHVYLKQMLLVYHAATDFSIKVYLEAKARTVLDIEKVVPAKKPRRKPSSSALKLVSHLLLGQ